MGTIADKLSYLGGTKTAIKNSIIAKGVSIADTDTFRSYAQKITQINGATVDEYSNVISIENLMRGTNETESAVIALACNHISQFLYGPDNQ